MSSGLVAKYGWLSQTGEAGCVTVMTPTTRAAVLDAFAADPDEVVALSDAALLPLAHVAVAEIGDAIVAYEGYGGEGSRVEVLQRASRHGQAANVFWDVTGEVTFACARRGRVLCWVDLLLNEDPSELPARLRRLLPADRFTADLVAVGAAMVETFTGIAFSAEMLAANEAAYVVHPRVEELEVETAENCELRFDHPGLVGQLAAAPGPMRRAVAEWSAFQALREVDLLDVQVVQTVIAGFGGSSAVSLSAQFMQFAEQVSRAEARAEARWSKKNNGDSGEPCALEELEYHWAIQRTSALEAARYACSEDLLSAALGAVGAAVSCFAWVDAQDAFIELVVHLIDLPRRQWPEQPSTLPTPLTAQQRADARDWAAWKPRYGTDTRVPALEAWERNHEPLRQRRLDYGPGVDPDIDDVERLSEQTRRKIALWAAHLALELADLHVLPWVAAALTAIDDGQALPPPFDDPQSAWARLTADPEAAIRHIASTDPDERDYQQAMALPVLAAASLPDATAAALNALWYARLTAGAYETYDQTVRRPLREAFGI